MPKAVAKIIADPNVPGKKRIVEFSDGSKKVTVLKKPEVVRPTPTPEVSQE